MKQKLNYGKTFILGFGFLAIMLCASLYDSFVPIFLRKFIDKAWLIGFLMTMDNYIGLFLQPAIGALSDRTNSRLGKRMPFILICMPLAAVFVSIIPNHWDLLSLIIIIVIFNILMACFRSPTVALMPDITPPALRSKANGVINFMGGLGAVIAYLVGSKLYDMDAAFPFYMAAILLIISVLILYFNIKEKRDSLTLLEAAERENKRKENQVAEQLTVLKNGGSVVMLLLAIFFWFIAYNAVSTFFTLYGTEYLHVTEGAAALRLTFFSGSLVLFSIPAGFLGTKLGKKKTIILGLLLMIATFGGIFFAKNINIIGILFIPAGAAWALININSYPFIVSMSKTKNIGAFTGLYYLFSSLAAIASPPLVGLLADLFGYGILFTYALVGFVLALVCILFVKSPKEEKIIPPEVS
jgi:maltose/moltooligosaccharide transporter